MSAEATGDAWRRSPFTHDRLLVHLAIADVVNDVHGNELWMLRETLAEKSRVSRGTVDSALRELVDQGWLEVLEKGGGRAKPTRYRYHLGTETAHEMRGNDPAVDPETAHDSADTAQPVESDPPLIPRTQPAAEATNDSPNPGSVPTVVAGQDDGAKKPRARNLVWDALVAVWGEPATRTARTNYGRVARDLRRDIGGDDAQLAGEVERRGRRAKSLWPTCTPSVLLSRWQSLERGGMAPTDQAPRSRSPWSQEEAS